MKKERGLEREARGGEGGFDNELFLPSWSTSEATSGLEILLCMHSSHSKAGDSVHQSVRAREASDV